MSAFDELAKQPEFFPPQIVQGPPSLWKHALGTTQISTVVSINIGDDLNADARRRAVEMADRIARAAWKVANPHTWQSLQPIAWDIVLAEIARAAEHMEGK